MNLIPSRLYLDSMFDDLISSSKNQFMRADIYEEGNNYHIDIDIPGLKKEDISIEADNGYLRIKASKLVEEDANKTYIRHERIYGEYERSFYLKDLDIDEIKAELIDGTLKITIPKKEKEQTKKTIEID